MSTRGLVIAGAMAFALLRVDDAGACSCMGPQDVLIGPKRTDSAPLNTRIRLESPSGGTSRQALLRVHGGATVDASIRSWADGELTFMELAPKAPLPPGTQYEVAVVDPTTYPSTTVLGTFKTGTTSDTIAPKLVGLGTASGHGNAHANGGDCSIHGPWIEIGPVVAEDPGRPDAQLLYAVWLGDANGTVDTTKPPAALLRTYEGRLTLGKRSLCDPHGFPIPKAAPFVHLALAVVDESGNTSASQRVKVDMRNVPKPSP